MSRLQEMEDYLRARGLLDDFEAQRADAERVTWRIAYSTSELIAVLSRMAVR